ncbi:PP2C family protein-serine/threonine phosphatase [Actinomadura scrupuli]|uniref:PP2C family protein-serine/threonine phosphatase n=1 Tax=Actinomadura scrupuli TaxID=559629 RepID=UPI003D980B1E
MNAPELLDLRATMRDRAVVAQARVVLAERLRCHVGEALQHLIWLARDLDLELPETAALVIAGRPPVLAPGDDEAAGSLVMDTARRLGEDRAAALEEVLRRLAVEDAAGDAELLAGLPDDPVARGVLDATQDCASRLVPVRDVEGRVIDFLNAALNERATDIFGRGAEELVGHRLLRVDPGTALNGLFESYVQVLETGEPYARGPFVFSTAQNGVARSARLSVRCVRVPTGVCVTWRYHDEEDRVRRRLERAERLALVGFGEWDLVADEQTWSPQMLANYGRTPQEGPVPVDELPKIVLPEDLPLMEDSLHTLFSRREPIELEHRIMTAAGENRHLWIFAEPVLDDSGRPVAVSVISQDITRRRYIEDALAETRKEFLRQQGETVRERQVTLTLRRAILPPDHELVTVPGLKVAVRSLAAESPARIGGDWYATRALQDGRALLAVGDAAGHGLAATAAMARMRMGLLGLAYTCEDTARLAGWLNALVSDLEPATIGTALLAHYNPATRLMDWTCAGHPPPILLRDGHAARMDIVPDPVLGCCPEVSYSTMTTQLLSGDLVLLYTDGLIERRGADLDERIGRLEQIIEDTAAEPDQVLEAVLARMGHDRNADDTTLYAIRVE